jgi:hypothetical protein
MPSMIDFLQNPLVIAEQRTRIKTISCVMSNWVLNSTVSHLYLMTSPDVCRGKVLELKNLKIQINLGPRAFLILLSSTANTERGNLKSRFSNLSLPTFLILYKGGRRHAHILLLPINTPTLLLHLLHLYS